MAGFVTMLGVGLVGGASAWGLSVAQAPAVSDVPPYVSGGAAAVAVTALAYVTRKLISGDLVSRPVAEYQRELSASIVVAGEREAAAMRVAEQYHKIAEQYHKDNEAMRRLLWRIDQHLGGPEERRTPRRSP